MSAVPYANRWQPEPYIISSEQKKAAADRRKVGKPNGKTAKKQSKVGK